MLEPRFRQFPLFAIIYQLVWCGSLDVIDHEDIDGTFGRFQSEPELLLQSLEERWSCILSLRAERLG